MSHLWVLNVIVSKSMKFQIFCWDSQAWDIKNHFTTYSHSLRWTPVIVIVGWSNCFSTLERRSVKSKSFINQCRGLWGKLRFPLVFLSSFPVPHKHALSKYNGSYFEKKEARLIYSRRPRRHFRPTRRSLLARNSARCVNSPYELFLLHQRSRRDPLTAANTLYASSLINFISFQLIDAARKSDADCVVSSNQAVEREKNHTI